MRTKGPYSILLSTLIIVLLTAPVISTISLLSVGQASAQPVAQNQECQKGEDNMDAAVPATEWWDPENAKPTLYREIKFPMSPFQMELVYPSRTSGIGTLGLKPKIYVLIHSSIYDPLVSYLNQYIVDVDNQGLDVLVYTYTGGTPENLRTFLQNAYPDLIGALLIGDIPSAWYEMDSEWGHEEFPMDLFYMDLDGVWTDADNDGLYDNHSGDRAPEIWVGRLKASGMTENEVSLLQNYFRKNHAYRTGALSLPQRALIYIDDDWTDWSNYIDTVVGFIYADRTLENNNITTGRGDYLNRLGQGWSLVHLMVHGWSGGHSFKVGPEWQYVYSSDIRSTDPHAFFYILYSCSNARYVENDYVGGWYVFSNTYGVAAISNTKVGGMWHYGDFYSECKTKILGTAFLQWFKNRVSGEGTDWYDRKWYYGMVILGDPTLYLTALRSVDVEISPSYQSGLQGETLNYNVVIRNMGTVSDNFALAASDDRGWELALSKNFLWIPPSENRTVTLSATIPENAIPCTEDKITVVATSTENVEVSDSAMCIAHRVKPSFGLATLYEVSLEMDAYIDRGSKLILKFYTYPGAYQGENVVWSGTTPDNVILSKIVPHPENKPVERTVLVLTDEAGNLLSTIASFIVRRSTLMGRLVDIDMEWPYAPERRPLLMSEIVDIDMQWPYAPF